MSDPRYITVVWPILHYTLYLHPFMKGHCEWHVMCQRVTVKQATELTEVWNSAVWIITWQNLQIPAAYITDNITTALCLMRKNYYTSTGHCWNMLFYLPCTGYHCRGSRHTLAKKIEVIELTLMFLYIYTKSRPTVWYICKEQYMKRWNRIYKMQYVANNGHPIFQEVRYTCELITMNMKHELVKNLWIFNDMMVLLLVSNVQVI